MPDSDEQRRANDQLMGRILQQLETHELDIRQYAPLTSDVVELRANFSNLRIAVDHLTSTIEGLQHSLDAEAKSRRSNRTLLWVAVVGLLGTFLSSTAAVLAAIL